MPALLLVATAAAATMALMSASGLVRAADPLSEDEATTKAIAFIRGDTYGDSGIEIRSHFKDVVLAQTGHNTCGPIRMPLWAFHFESSLQDQRIDGWVHIDAVSGEVECSSIPFLRVGG